MHIEYDLLNTLDANKATIVSSSGSLNYALPSVATKTTYKLDLDFALSNVSSFDISISTNGAVDGTLDVLIKRMYLKKK